MKKRTCSRLLSYFLALALCLGITTPALAVSNQTALLPFAPTEVPPANPAFAANGMADDTVNYADTDVVRVSIVLDGLSTLDAGFSTIGIASNTEAIDYRLSLRRTQDSVVTLIEKATGEKLDIQWQLTLAANLISANVAYGQIGRIKSIPGVADVVLEEQYVPCETETGETANPNMATSSAMIGSSAAYAAGLTGAGTRITIIDTGIDMDHQSFSAEALEYALSLEDSVSLLGVEEIERLLPQMNIVSRSPHLTAKELYQNTKLPFGYNYVDRSAEYLDHDQDVQGEHGSHVAGIAAANAYIPDGKGGFVRALDTVQVQGVAPNAQIIVMKVFGKNGGAYASDYMAALEDAVVLGSDSINLSLGAAKPGFTRSKLYQELMQRLTQSDTVVTISAGNSGSWVDNAKSSRPGNLYIDDVNMDMVSTPGSHTNSLTVASADNVGFIGTYFTLAERRYFYTESSYGNAALRTLAGEHEYIFIDGFGTEEDFKALASVLNGKIAICSRGSNSFYQKAEAAVKYGAIATIVYNDREGSLKMDLTEYTQTAPCISVTQAEGKLIRNASTAVKDTSGNVLYYTGSLDVSGYPGSEMYDLDYCSISSFSSWGVPGSLEMKPEITAPGGNIYSVDGSVAGGKSYEYMSGTSMASPQVAGMAALVSQFVRENGLNKNLKISVRALTQSLLMSTARPMLEEASGLYYPVLRQGAGLANVGDAIAAQSYILMGKDATKTYSDGKVKAELGDDPERTGVYCFTFTLHNLTEASQTFTLGADLFTQAVLSEDGRNYMDTRTALLRAEFTWLVNGRTLVPANLDGLDFNGDGLINTGDVQAILDYVTQKRETLENADLADLNADGAITSYDAYLLLDRLNTGTFVLEGNGKAEITMTAALTPEQKERLDADYPSGAYIEGYVFAKQLPTAEGVSGTNHSIPVLAYYGNWSDPSMFDKGTYAERISGYDVPGYLGVSNTNALLLLYHDLAAGNYFMAGNPYGADAEYHPERWAINSADTLYQQRISLIRNASVLAMVVMNQKNEILYLSQLTEQVSGAYYHYGNQAWRDSAAVYTLNKKVSTLGAEEGDVLYVGAVAIPEYYETNGTITEAELRELLTSGKLGKGASITSSMMVDDTTPEILSVCKNLLNGNLEVTVRDNRYAASVRVVSPSGEILAQTIVDQPEPSKQITVTVDLSQATVGPECTVVVGDYARNESACVVTYGGEETDYTGQMFGFTSGKYRGSGNRWMRIEPEKLYYNSATEYDGTENVAYTDISVSAAEYVGGYVYIAAEDGYFYVAQQGVWNRPVRAGSFTDTTATITDMAFNSVDGKLYAIGANNTVYSVDYLTCALTPVVRIGRLENPRDGKLQDLTRLAIDDNGTFYTINHGAGSKAFLYTFTLSDAVDGVIETLTPINNTAKGGVGFSNYFNGALFWDHDKGILYFANSTVQSGGTMNLLSYINLETGKATRANSTYGGGFNAATVGSRLFVTVSGAYVVPSNTIKLPDASGAVAINLSDGERTVLKGTQLQLECDVYPWNLSDKRVTWESSNNSVVTVRDGMVTAVGVGTAVITATSVSEPHLTASCSFTVNPLTTIHFQGLVNSKDGISRWAEMNTDTPEQWSAVGSPTIEFVAGTLYNGMLYAHDGEGLYRIDPDSFEPTLLTPISAEWAFTDATTCPEQNGLFGGILGICRDGIILELMNPENGSLLSWDVSNVFANNQMAAIAFSHSGTFDWSTYKNMPANFHYVITENGELWSIILFSTNNGGSYTAYRTKIGDTGLKLHGASSLMTGCRTSMIYDGASGYLILSVYIDEEPACLYAIEPTTCAATPIGQFGGSVQSVNSLYQYTRITDLTVRLNVTDATLFVSDEKILSARVLPTDYNDQVTWSSSDETVATVDANGRVTALKPGTAIITATSVAEDDNGKASASCTVTVKPLTQVSLRVGAQVVTKDGTAWVTLNTEDMTHTVQSGNATRLTGAGMHDGKLYGTNSDFVNSGNFIWVDPDRNFREFSGYGCSAAYAVRDLTTAPTLDVPYQDENGEPGVIKAFGVPLYLSHNQCLVMLKDATTGAISGWNLLNQISNLSAITYAGRGVFTDESGAHNALTYYVLCMDGSLYRFYLWADYDAAAQNGLAYSLRFIRMGDIGLKFSDPTSLSMTLIRNGLVIADSTTASLYWVELDETLSSGKIANLPGVTAISGLYDPAETNASEINQNVAVPTSGTLLSETLKAEPLYEMKSTVAHKNENQNEEADGHQVKVSVTAKNSDGEDVAATNGYLTVKYDPQVLTLKNLKAFAEVVSIVETEGILRIAYASSGIAAGAPVISLYFEFTGIGDTKIEITNCQTNDIIPNSIETLLLSCLHMHTELRNAESATCTEDGYSGDLYCLDCNKMLKNGEVIPANCPSGRFTDLNTNLWYHSATDFVIRRGYMNGVSDSQFAPAQALTRGQLATVLYRLAGEPETKKSIPFIDVPSGAYYAEAVAWAYDAGIIKGIDPTHFAPNAAATREQMITMVARYVSYCGISIKADSLPEFPDVDIISDYAIDAVCWAVENGLLLGSDGKLEPKCVTTRAQFATVIMRLCSNIFEQ